MRPPEFLLTFSLNQPLLSNGFGDGFPSIPSDNFLEGKLPANFCRERGHRHWPKVRDPHLPQQTVLANVVASANIPYESAL